LRYSRLEVMSPRLMRQLNPIRVVNDLVRGASPVVGAKSSVTNLAQSAKSVRLDIVM
jgi:hypothetical protein